MLLPIGHEGHPLRRRPWVTIVLGTLCLLVFLDQQLDARHNEAVVQDSYIEALEYLIEHPWLEPPEVLEWNTHAKALLEQLRQQRPSHGLSRFVAEEQATLDQLASRWQESLDQLPFFRWGYQRDGGRPETLLTSQFIHAGWLHLFGNLLFLAILGPPLEDVLGRFLLPTLYLLGGAFAAYFHGALTVHPELPLGGASGPVAVLMGMFMVRFASTRMRFLLILFPFFIGRVNLPAWFFLAGWALLELSYASVFEVDATLTSGVAHLAHFGGFAFGMVIMFLFGMLSVESRWIRPRLGIDSSDSAEASRAAGTTDGAAGGESAPQRPTADQLRLHAAELGPSDGMRFLQREAHRHRDVELWMAAWDHGRDHGFGDRLASVARGIIDAAVPQLQSQVTLEMVEVLREVLDRVGPQVLSASRRIELADALLGADPLRPPTDSLGHLPYGAVPLATQLLDSALIDRVDLSPKDGLRLAQWLRRSDPQRAARLATAFLALSPREEAVRADLEEIAGS